MTNKPTALADLPVIERPPFVVRLQGSSGFLAFTLNSQGIGISFRQTQTGKDLLTYQITEAQFGFIVEAMDTELLARDLGLTHSSKTH